MTKEDALKMLKAVPESDVLWRPNKIMTVSQAKKIMIDGLQDFVGGTILDNLFVKRVYQVIQNKSRPEYQLED